MNTMLAALALLVALAALAAARRAGLQTRATLATLAELIELLDGVDFAPVGDEKPSAGEHVIPAANLPVEAASIRDTIIELGRQGASPVDICRRLAVSRREVGLALALGKAQRGGTLND